MIQIDGFFGQTPTAVNAREPISRENGGAMLSVVVGSMLWRNMLPPIVVSPSTLGDLPKPDRHESRRRFERERLAELGKAPNETRPRDVSVGASGRRRAIATEQHPRGQRSRVDMRRVLFERFQLDRLRKAIVNAEPAHVSAS